MNTISFDWVRIIALMPFRESETTSNRHRTINYVYLGFSLFLMVLIPALSWKGISCLNDVADLELSLFAPLPAMWGLGLPIQCFGKKDGHHKRGEIIIPDTHSSSPHSSRECQGEDGRRVNVNVFNFHINLLQNYFLFNFRQNNYHMSVNLDIHVQNTTVVFPSSPNFVSSSTQDVAMPSKRKRGPKGKPRVEDGEDPLNDGIRTIVDNAFQHLGCNLGATDGAAIIKVLKTQRKRFLRRDYEQHSLCAWLVNTYGDHFKDGVRIDTMSHSDPTPRCLKKTAELFGVKYTDIIDQNKG